LAFDRLPDGVSSIALPCGKCFGCLKSKALGITVRAVAESRMHDFASFITLTVSDNNLPLVFPHGLCHRPWQLFAKRLRKKIGSFTFLMCGEYGAQTMRPHYHAVIFGHRFVDSFVDHDRGCFVASRVLADAWPHGLITCSDCNVERCAYVAGYTCKDFALGRGKEFYEMRGLGLPYVRWSRNPSLGLRWLQKYQDDLLDDNFDFTFRFSGKVFHFGSRYFLERIRLQSPELYDKICASRRARFADVDITGIMRQYEQNRRSCELKQYHLLKKKEVSLL